MKRKRQKIDHGLSTASTSTSFHDSAFPRNNPAASSSRSKTHDTDKPNEHIDLDTTEVKNGESIAALRKMVLGKVEYKESQTVLGKYIAIDCEMVGVGIDGDESSLARVSVVNYTGAVVLDVFVRQRERVVDYRTQWSGVRNSDLGGKAKTFEEVQKTVAELIKDRILVGHAVHNDLKALLLSHPSPQIRDTQSLAYKFHVVKSRRPALRVLVKQELGIVIQGGEHSSVTDARATMALFRLHKKQFESGFRPLHTPTHQRSKDKPNTQTINNADKASQLSPSPEKLNLTGKKRKRAESELDSGSAEGEATSASLQPPSGPHSPALHSSASSKSSKSNSKSRPPSSSLPRKGISSGLSTVIRRPDGAKEVRRKGGSSQKGNTPGVDKKSAKSGEKWWTSLGGGKKGSLSMRL